MLEYYRSPQYDFLYTHMMLRFKPGWVSLDVGPDDLTFDVYPKESIEDWHRRHNLWLD